ncbi:MAG: carotenoid oxygenase family protein [Cyanobacteria bacterium J06581_3]
MTGKVMSNECVLERDCEFPQVPAAQVAQPWQHTYLLMHRDGVSTGEDWFGAVGRFDYESGSLLQIVDAETMGEPVCRLALPSVVLIGFHGTWQA